MFPMYGDKDDVKPCLNCGEWTLFEYCPQCSRKMRQNAPQTPIPPSVGWFDVFDAVASIESGRTCGLCKGEGYLLDGEPCPFCDGRGVYL